MEKRTRLARYLLHVIEVCTDKLQAMNNLPQEHSEITEADIKVAMQAMSSLDNISIVVPY